MRYFRLFTTALVAALILCGAAFAGDKRPKPVANSLGMKLVHIPAGEFLMGSAPGDWGRGRNEEPQRRIRITRPFLMGAGSVTNKEFLTFVDATKYNPVPLGESDVQFLYYTRGKGKAKYDKLPPNRPDHPILWVSWYSACRFCDWLSRKESLPPVYVFTKPSKKGLAPEVLMARPFDGGYRLPTEAEWEYAARAGTTTAYSFGDNDRLYNRYAFSYYFNPFSGAFNNDAVLARKPNPWGLHQMHGNVADWCWDRYAKRYDPNQVVDPTGAVVGRLRVERGGAIRLPPRYGRSASRMMSHPCTTRFDLGFRVVRNVK